MLAKLGKISAQPLTSVCVQFLDKENKGGNNKYPIWGYRENYCFVLNSMELHSLHSRRNYGR